MASLAIFRLGPFAWDLSFGILWWRFSLRTFAWELPVITFPWELSLGSFRLGTSLGNLRSRTFVYELSLGNFAWELSLGNFCFAGFRLGSFTLVSSAWILSLRIFRLGSSAPELPLCCLRSRTCAWDLSIGSFAWDLPQDLSLGDFRSATVPWKRSPGNFCLLTSLGNFRLGTSM